MSEVASIIVHFRASHDAALEVHHARSVVWSVEIPWNFDGVTSNMRLWSYLHPQPVNFPEPVNVMPTVEQAVFLIRQHVDEAIVERKEYLRGALRAVEELAKRGAAGMGRDKVKNSAWYPELELSFGRWTEFTVRPSWHSVHDAVLHASDMPEAWYKDSIIELCPAIEKAMRDVTEELRAETKRRKTIEVERQELEEEATRKRRDQQLEAIDAGMRRAIAGDNVDTARWNDGTMGEQEAKRILRNCLFLTLEKEDEWELVRYQRMVASEVCPDDPGSVEFEVTEDYETPLTRSEWVSWKNVQDLVEREQNCAEEWCSWGCKLRLHEASVYGECQARVVTVRVTATVGDWVLGREYAITNQNSK